MLESDSYTRAVQTWKLKRDIAGNDHGSQPGEAEFVLDSSLAFLVDGNDKESSYSLPTVEQTSTIF